MRILRVSNLGQIGLMRLEVVNIVAAELIWRHKITVYQLLQADKLLVLSMADKNVFGDFPLHLLANHLSRDAVVGAILNRLTALHARLKPQLVEVALDLTTVLLVKIINNLLLLLDAVLAEYTRIVLICMLE